MDEFDDEEKVISQYSCQIRRTNSFPIAIGIEHSVEAATVRVRILFRPQKNNNNEKNITVHYE